MSRVLLVHWNAEEAKAKARTLKDLGHTAEILCDSEKPNLGRVRESPPDLFLIDLNRLPSQGREIAGYFRRAKTTRQVPILFVDGDANRVSRARQLIPDADFGKWEKIESALKKASRRKVAKPVVPGTMAGYSGTPLPKKLGIREKYNVLLVNAPERFERKLEPMPAGSEFVSDARRAQIAVLFALAQVELVRDFRPLVKALPERTSLWIAWPKKASGVATDLTENIVREYGLAHYWMDYKVCAIDETWSGLCFARKRHE
jgi:CheY-like chemotaxis protein